jgi:SAM-dependent methyltransferase
MDIVIDRELACPTCHASLDLVSEAARCSECATEYPMEQKVLCTDRSDVFLGEFGTVRMRDFIRSARDMGWQKAVEEMSLADPAVRTLLLSPDRANFINILNTKKKYSILDLGAGMGAVSLQLSRYFDRVFAVDQTFERLAFLQVISEQRDAKAIRPICHRDVFNLPFASDSLDAVVLIGVFEYFPLSYPDIPVRDVQFRALTEINRVLSPGGVLFLATKNRFGWPNWAGAKDNSGLRFGSLLPRWLANLASLALCGKPFRVVTDSPYRYRKLLNEAGFAEPGFFWPVGGYQAPQSWVDLKDNNAIFSEIQKNYPSGFKRLVLSLLRVTGTVKHFVPHFGMVARKGPARE